MKFRDRKAYFILWHKSQGQLEEFIKQSYKMANKHLFHAIWRCTVCILQTLQLHLSQISPASGIEMKPAKLTLIPSGWGFTEVRDRQPLITALKKMLATPLACQICFLEWEAADSDPVLITPVSYQQTNRLKSPFHSAFVPLVSFR